jgi:hypothetical protein
VNHTLRPADCDDADSRFADRPEFAAYCEAVAQWKADVAKFRELFTADEIEKEWSDALDASADAWREVAARSGRWMSWPTRSTSAWVTAAWRTGLGPEAAGVRFHRLCVRS